MALTSANRIAARDVYDLALIIETKLEPPVELLAEHGEAVLTQSLDQLWGKLEALDWPRFEAEVLPTMPLAVRSRIDRDSWETTRSQVGVKVEQWLTQAAEVARSRNRP